MGWAKKFFFDKLKLSLLGVVLIFVVAVAYIFNGVLGKPLTSTPPQVSIALHNTGGLYTGSVATYRGVKVGKVTDIELTRDGARATVNLDSGVKVPASSKAVVRSLSPVGEQYVDFQPQTQSGPYLHDGSTISASSTEIPTQLGETVVAVQRLLNQIDPTQLKAVLDSVATGLNGTGDDLGSIIEHSDQVLADLQQSWPQTKSLLQDTRPALDVPLQKQADLASLGSSAKQFATFLDNYHGHLISQLERAPKQLDAVRKMAQDWAALLPTFLPEAIKLGDFLITYDPHLRETLQQYAPGFHALASILAGGKLHLKLLLQKDTRCSYGTTRHEPTQTGTSFQTGGHCSASFPHLQRGAAHAPGPVG